MLKLIIIFLLIPICGLTQNRQSIYFSASPTYSYRFYKVKPNGNIYNKYGTQPEDAKSELDSTEFSTIGFDFDLGINFHLNKSTVSVGLGFSHFGENDLRTYSFGHFDWTTFTPVYDGYEEMKSSFRYSVICLPITYGYKLLSGKISLSIFAGLKPGYLVSQKYIRPERYEEVFYKSDLKFETAQFSNFVLSGFLGVRIEKDLGEKWSVGLEPNFNLQLTPLLNFETELFQYNYQVGVFCRVCRKIK